MFKYVLVLGICAALYGGYHVMTKGFWPSSHSKSAQVASGRPSGPAVHYNGEVIREELRAFLADEAYLQTAQRVYVEGSINDLGRVIRVSGDHAEVIVSPGVTVRVVAYTGRSVAPAVVSPSPTPARIFASAK